MEKCFNPDLLPFTTVPLSAVRRSNNRRNNLLQNLPFLSDKPVAPLGIPTFSQNNPELEELKLRDYFMHEVRKVVSPNTEQEKIIGNKQAKAEVEAALITMCDPHKIIHEEFLWRAMLLVGFSGTGKTRMMMSAAVGVSKKLGHNISVYQVQLAQILSKYVGGSEQLIRSLFLAASVTKPSLIFFDEIDALMGSRENTNSDSGTKIQNALLTALDGYDNEPGVFVLGTSNRGHAIDTAFLRLHQDYITCFKLVKTRFRRIFFVDLPSAQERKLIFQKYIDLCSMRQPIDTTQINYNELVEQTRGFSGDDIKKSVTDAAITCVSVSVNGRLISLKEWLKEENEKLPSDLQSGMLTHQHILDGIQTVTPVIDKNTRRKIIRFANKHCVNKPNFFKRKIQDIRRSLDLTKQCCKSASICLPC